MMRFVLKFAGVILTILLAFLIGTTILFRYNKNRDYQKEMLATFENNKDLFSAVANELAPFSSFGWIIQRGGVPNSSGHDKTFFSNGLSVVIQLHQFQLSYKDPEKASALKDIAATSTNIEKMIKKLRFRQIQSPFIDPGDIVFIKDTTVGRINGVIFAPNDPPQSKFYSNLTELEPGWYYYEG
ncbi:MAG: hypothetical protein IJC88_05370 [Oscillospiraceae bacterium]|nr:hypothetical protein [Oscillospiraceae bacterium]